MVLLECACIVCFLGKMIQAWWFQCVIAHRTLLPSWARHILKTEIHYTYCRAEKQRKFLSPDWPTVTGQSLPSTQLLVVCPLWRPWLGFTYQSESCTHAHTHKHTHNTHAHNTPATYIAFTVTCGVFVWHPPQEPSFGLSGFTTCPWGASLISCVTAADCCYRGWLLVSSAAKALHQFT